MPHIGVDARELQSHMTGIGRYLRNVLPHLIAQRPNWKWTLLHTNPAAASQIQGVERVLLQSKFGPWQDQVEVPRLIEKRDVQLFFSPYYKLPLRLRCPAIIVVHDINVLYSPEYGSLEGHLYRRYFSINLRLSMQRAQVIFAVSDWTRRKLLERFTVDEAKVRVNYLGLEPDLYGQKPHQGWESYKRDKGLDQYLLYVGNLKPHKNLSMLIKAYAEMPMRLREKYRMVIAGNHGQLNLRKESERLGLKDLIFLGHVPDDFLPDLYRSARLFLFPSLLEGFGLPPLEAMAVGVPVISSNATSLAEVVGEGGILLDPRDQVGFRDAMASLLEDPERHCEQSKAGVLWVRRFPIRQTAAKILEAMEDIL